MRLSEQPVRTASSLGMMLPPLAGNSHCIGPLHTHQVSPVVGETLKRCRALVLMRDSPVIRTDFRLSRDWQLRDWQSSITSRKIEKLLKAALGSLMSYRQKLFQPTAKDAGMYDGQELEVASCLCQLQAGLGRVFKAFHTKSSECCLQGSSCWFFIDTAVTQRHDLAPNIS